jgi:hypothetical protein
MVVVLASARLSCTGLRLCDCGCMKRCAACGEVKPLTHFNRHKLHADGLTSSCRVCINGARVRRRIEQGLRRPDPPTGFKYCAKCGTEKPHAEFYIRKSGRHAGKPHAHCIVCFKADCEARRRAKGALPFQAADGLYARRKRLAQYGLTLETYDALLAEQDGVCPGCGAAANRDGANFAVDHDHGCCPGDTSCGKCIRGLLCRQCNWAIGQVGDDPETLRRLATYLVLYESSRLAGP